MSTYNNRQDFEMDHWPQLRQAFTRVVKTVQSDKEISKHTNTPTYQPANTPTHQHTNIIMPFRVHQLRRRKTC